MTMTVIRELTSEDEKRVDDTALRFCERHGINPDGDALLAIDYWLDQSYPEQITKRRKLWYSCFCRALKVPNDNRTRIYSNYICIKYE